MNVVTFRDLKQLSLLVNVKEAEIEDFVKSIKIQFGIASNMKIKQFSPEYRILRKPLIRNSLIKFLINLLKRITMVMIHIAISIGLLQGVQEIRRMACNFISTLCNDLKRTNKYNISFKLKVLIIHLKPLLSSFYFLLFLRISNFDLLSIIAS